MNWNQLMCPARARGNVRKRAGADLRTEFERDYHRVISSASFRRLQDKTQVFPLDQSDFIRTRLTHSLEVASFARSIGQNISKMIIEDELDPEFTEQTKDDVCAVLECAGLLHDIGNPPFGHFGESAIQDWFKKNLGIVEYDGKPLSEILNKQMQADLTNFEGNTQAFRVVTKLHFMVDENGMNLTQALLATIMKYPGSSLDVNYDKNDPERDITHKKMGYFYAERELFDMVQESCGTNGRRHPLSFALEAADDIAYKTADIEDAVKKKLLNKDILVHELTNVVGEVKIKKLTLMDELNEPLDPDDRDVMVYKNIKRLNSYFDRAIQNDYDDPDLYAVQNWVVRVQGLGLSAAAVSFVTHYSEIMNGTYKHELLDDSEAKWLMDLLGDVAYRYAFCSGPILKLEVAADTIFEFLLDRMVKALVYFDTPMWKEKATSVDCKIVGLISPTFMHVYRASADRITCKGKEAEYEKLYLRMLLATDYISGMTDSYAKRLYQQFNGIM